MSTCDCDQNAATYTCKKEGPNKGRKFNTCKTRTCKFFEWVDEINSDKPRCACGKPVATFSCKKGPNSGRKFSTCKDKTCKYFEWLDKVSTYSPNRFRSGACFRCGRYNCDATDCECPTDVFGNEIPDNWVDY